MLRRKEGTMPEKPKGATGKATPTKKAAAAKPAAPAKGTQKATKSTAAKPAKPAAVKGSAKKAATKAPTKAPTKAAASKKPAATKAGKPAVSKKASATKAGKPAAGKKTPATKAGKSMVAPRTPAKAAPKKAPASKTGSRMTVQQARKKAASATRSKYWDRAQRRARRLLRRKDELLDVAKQADKLAARMRSGPMARLIEQLKAMLRLVRAYASGEYKNVSWESMVLVVAAIAYIVSPIDLIPDFIPVVGYLDDAAVLSFVLRIVRDELDEFIAWEKETGRAPKRRS